jgi:hypothetical protein
MDLSQPTPLMEGKADTRVWSACCDVLIDDEPNLPAL